MNIIMYTLFMRSDAQKNYTSLLVAADEAFTELGAEASLEEIARRAHVGIGSLYRHFPTRQQLVRAVFVRWHEELIRKAEILTQTDDSLKALMQWLTLLLAISERYQGIKGSLFTAGEPTVSNLDKLQTQTREAGQKLLHNAQKQGVIRSDITIDEVIAVVHGIGVALSLIEQVDDVRILDILLYGMASSDYKH